MDSYESTMLLVAVCEAVLLDCLVEADTWQFVEGESSGRQQEEKEDDGLEMILLGGLLTQREKLELLMKERIKKKNDNFTAFRQIAET